MDAPEALYVTRCYVCGHKIGMTDDPSGEYDVCERCDD